MIHRVALLLVLAGMGAAAPRPRAQTAPAREVQVFAPLLGTWRGQGVWQPDPRTPAGRWTSRSTYRWTLGGHFLREDTRIEGEGMADAVRFTAFYGWDRERQRHVSFTVSNAGTLAIAEVHWTDENTMVTATQRREQGQVVLDRWMTRLQGTQTTLVGQRARGAGDFFEQVRGTRERISKTADDVRLGEASFTAGAPSTSAAAAKMKPLESLVGTYGFRGWTIPLPGVPRTAITGVETVRMVLGGLLLQFDLRGEPTPDAPGFYERLGFMAWDPQDACYRTVWLTNTGEVRTAECRAAGERKLIMTAALLLQGQPAALRQVLELDDAGTLRAVHTDAIVADGVPTRILEGAYERQKS